MTSGHLTLSVNKKHIAKKGPGNNRALTRKLNLPKTSLQLANLSMKPLNEVMMIIRKRRNQIRDIFKIFNEIK